MNSERNLMGDRIKERRKLANLSQTELGDKIGVTYATISKYESGEIKSIDATILNSIAKYTNTDINYFLMNTDTPNTNTNTNINNKDLHMAASSDVDLAKLAKLDKNKQKAITDNINNMINMFYNEFGKGEK